MPHWFLPVRLHRPEHRTPTTRRRCPAESFWLVPEPASATRKARWSAQGRKPATSNGQTLPQGTPLPVSRGMVVFVQAQDLLHGMAFLSTAQFNAFDSAMYDLILTTDNA